ncbi:MAG: hypothetical protein ACOVQX_05765 [Legionella sp.]
MKKLILNPTDMSQWHALINEAQVATKLLLSEPLESYLVFLLMRFATTPALLDTIMAIDFLVAMQKSGRHSQLQGLQDVGDKSLLVCGLFPGVATRRHLTLDYFAEIGRAAYFAAGRLQESESIPLYFQLSAQFHSLQAILNAMRGNTLQYLDGCSGIMTISDSPTQ